MYIPSYFKVTSIEEAEAFIQKHSFATIVTTQNERPIATHIPVLLEKDQDGNTYLTGHVARGNPQWKTFTDANEVLVIFQGPHAYISSTWYNHDNVPTWNYQAVHVYGKATIFSEEQLKQSFVQMLKKYEQHRQNPLTWEKLSTEVVEKQIKGTVGFKIKINEIQAAYKMSQNRNEEDFHTIINELYKEQDTSAHQLADEMKHGGRK